MAGVRRLKILPCSESWSDMRSDGADGARWCERCAARVNAVADLEPAEFEALLEQSGDARVCMRFELERGQPKLATGLASVMVVALSACASTPEAETVAPTGSYASAVTLEPLVADHDSEIVGFAVDVATGEAIAGAWVMLEGEGLDEPLSTTTDERGMYGFANLPAGTYVVSTGVWTWVEGHVELPEHTRARASFAVDSDVSGFLMGGLLYEYDPGFSSPGPYLLKLHDS